MAPRPAKPISSMAQVEGSGADIVGETKEMSSSPSPRRTPLLATMSANAVFSEPPPPAPPPPPPPPPPLKPPPPPAPSAAPPPPLRRHRHRCGSMRGAANAVEAAGVASRATARGGRRATRVGASVAARTQIPSLTNCLAATMAAPVEGECGPILAASLLSVCLQRHFDVGIAVLISRYVGRSWRRGSGRDQPYRSSEDLADDAISWKTHRTSLNLSRRGPNSKSPSSIASSFSWACSPCSATCGSWSAWPGFHRLRKPRLGRDQK